MANAWMNAPAGFKIIDGRVVDFEPGGGDAEQSKPSMKRCT